MALHAGGSAPNITAFLLLEFVALVSGQCGVPQWPGTTRLSRGVRGSCGIRPLRPPASLLHNAAFCEVFASRYAKAALGVVHRLRALTGLQNRPYAKWPELGAGESAVGAPRSHSRPTRRRLHALLAVVAPWHQSGASRSVLVSGLRPVMLCVPPPAHRGLAAARHWPRAPVARPPPEGGSLNRRAILQQEVLAQPRIGSMVNNPSAPAAGPELEVLCKPLSIAWAVASLNYPGVVIID